MKKQVLSLAAFLMLLLTIPGYAGDNVVWDKTFDKNFNWMKLTDVGVMVVGTNDALYVLDPETGEVNYKNEDLGGMEKEAMQIIPFTPFMGIEGKGMLSFKPYYIINLIDGTPILDTKEKEIQAISDRKFIPTVEGLLIAGSLTVKGGGGMVYMMLDVNTGEEIWRKPNLTKGMVTTTTVQIGDAPAPPSAIWPLTEEPAIILQTYEGGIYKINAETGEVIWNNDIKRSKQAILGENQDVVYARTQKGEVMAIDMETGENKWNEPFELPDEFQNLIETKFGVVFQTKDKKEKVVLVNAETGLPIWEKPEKIKDEVYAVIPDEKGLLVYMFSGKHELNLIDTKTGEFKWKKSARIDGAISSFESLDKGYLIQTPAKCNVYSYKDGSELIKKGLESKDNDILMANGDGFKLLYTDEEIYKMPLSSLKMERIAKKVKFEEKESPNSFRKIDSGFLLSSSQNLMLVDASGNIKYHQFFKAVDRSVAGKIAIGAMGAATMAMSVASSASQYSTMGYNAGAYYATNTSSMYGNYAEGFANMSATSFSAMGKRFKATKESDNYAYIMCDNVEIDGEEAIGLVQVRKKDGEVLSKIHFKEREPVYEVDEITEKVFFQSDKAKLTCFGL